MATAGGIRNDVALLGKFFQARVTSNPTKRVRLLYEMYPPGYLFADHSTYINYGYWEDDCTSLDHASERMADVLAEAARFEPDDTVLDVGFGYGDQDLFWLRSRKPKKIYGLNITPRQVASARRRAEAEGLGDRLDFRVGSATAIPFSEASFDRVVALECAHHFYPRDDFLMEAYRVLRPGGTFAAADVVPVDAGTPRRGIRSLPLTWVGMSVADENWYTRDDYARRLTELGFVDVEVRSIRDRVYEPWRAHILRKINDPAFARRIGNVYRRMLGRMWRDQPLLRRELELLDYVIVAARKPAQPRY